MPLEPIFDVEQAIEAGADPAVLWEAMVCRAVESRVSDIHVMTQRDGAELAFRLDGDMCPQGRASHEFARKMISHVKTVGGIDLGESRRPTEGRMKVDAEGRQVELRVSAIPTIHGQDLVVRIFDRKASLLELPGLGLEPEQLDYLHDVVQRPHGLILVSGPTGSGKTTSLYAILRRLAGQGRKILTIENPVEFDLDGVNQTQVNSRIGVSFATLLTAILRQDPNIIMVGEIRDEETARTAVRAANTGHLVLATTHATRSSRAVESLLNLGVHPYFLAVSLRAVLAQVLVKRICENCKTPLPETGEMPIEPSVRRRLGDEKALLYQGAGCEKCRGVGYRGRLGLFELFIPDEHITDRILRRRPVTEIEEAFAASGAMTLEHAGKLAALRGLTTMEQIVEVLPMV